MQIERVSVDSLFPHPKNPRRHNEAQVGAMVDSLTKFGQIRPVVADEEGKVLIGHCILLALQKMGRSHAEVLRVSGLSENEKTRLLLADNKVGELGFDDFDDLWELIKSMDGDYDIPGYDDQTLNDLLGRVDEATMELGSEKPTVAGSEFRSGFSTEVVGASSPSASPAPSVERTIKCPHCGETIKL